MKFLLGIRSLFFLALMPGIVAGYVPYRILLASGRLHPLTLSVASVIAAALTLSGVVVLLRCVWDFFSSGKGTLAPIDPPRHLVVRGLYGYTRNPMYNGVIAVLVGEAWLFTSVSLLTYAGLVLVAFHLFVVVYEEPALTAQFHESYHAYRRSVPRWGFTTRHTFARRMDSNFHFGPARTGERTAYGARTPDASPIGILEWADFMRAQGVTRVCCLLDATQLAGFQVNLEAEYKRLFGTTSVLMEPIADHHLCSLQALKGNILPFLSIADTGGERAVIHCWGGNGRTGHVLAAWLVAARRLSPREAVEAVEATGRLPQEAVLAGNATFDELIELLTSCV